jgi:hypothetical protein
MNKSSPVQITLRVSPELWELMRQGMQSNNHRSMNEFIRSCIRAYLDETGDILGSRRHFSKRMSQRMDRLEAMLLWHSLSSQMLLSRAMFTVLDELNPDAELDPPTPNEQMSRAVEVSKRELPKFIAEQTQIVTEIEKFRRQKKPNK